MSKALVCELCQGLKCHGDEVKATAQFVGSSRVLKVSVGCGDRVIGWNERCDENGLAPTSSNAHGKRAA